MPLPSRLPDDPMTGPGFSVVYLHGFASSPQSSKATFLSSRLRARGVHVETPDLNLPDFSTLTVSRMLAQVDGVVDRVAGPVVVIGSSLGGFVAIHAAARHADRVRALVLLAPALEFDPEWASTGPQGIDLAEWKRHGALDVFHYGYGRVVPIQYALYEDASKYDAQGANLTMAIQVFQGRGDTSVDPAAVEAWSRRRPNVELHMLDDDHQLSHSLDYIWEESARFLTIG